MSKRRTCAGCKNLQRDIIMDFPMYSCKPTGYVVPHGTEREGDELMTTFWRVPLSCPLPNSEVVKTENKAPKKYWVIQNA